MISDDLKSKFDAYEAAMSRRVDARITVARTSDALDHAKRVYGIAVENASREEDEVCRTREELREAIENTVLPPLDSPREVPKTMDRAHRTDVRG